MDDFQLSNSAAKKSGEVSPADLRILLWDIDGTLLQSTRPGSFRKYFAPAIKKVFGTSGKIAEVSASGATDLQIVFHALKDEGFAIEQISGRMNEFVPVLCAGMKEFLASNKENYEILSGAKEILSATENDPRFVNALLTGNIRCGAEIKCRAVGVWNFFENSPNTYGDISHDRRELPFSAAKNFGRKYEFDFQPSQFILIGDTPFDIAAAHHYGAKALAVETGRGIGRDALQTKNPDFLIEDLSDTQKVLDILASF